MVYDPLIWWPVSLFTCSLLYAYAWLIFIDELTITYLFFYLYIFYLFYFCFIIQLFSQSQENFLFLPLFLFLSLLYNCYPPCCCFLLLFLSCLATLSFSAYSKSVYLTSKIFSSIPSASPSLLSSWSLFSIALSYSTAPSSPGKY